MTFTIIFKKSGDAADCLPQVILVRQEDQTKMIRMWPVEAATLNQQDLFLLQQLGYELLVVLDRIDLGIEAGKPWA